jgi:predicted nuclease of restriction endonuclease-like RecB superfamily
MLTADHVRARKKDGELIVRRLDAKERARATELARAYLAVARAHVGRTRDELVEAWAAVEVAPRERRVADGLRKLIEDLSEMSAESAVDPIELRREVFSAASVARASGEGRVDRALVLGGVAIARGLSPEDVERALYSDLKGEQILSAVDGTGPEALVERYDRGQVQAVLLRAVRVIADVTCAAPAAYRALFRELKFRRLLYRIERRERGYRIEIDGPFSLFESVTRYGLALALLLPALEECEELALVAEIRWGQRREPLVFRHFVGKASNVAGVSGPTPAGSAPATAGVRDDVAELIAGFAALDTPWRVHENEEILDLPGIGVCVPDLVFSRAGQREKIYFEALGFWSRDAVWKRVELAKGGLSKPVLFAVSSRLRVSEAVLTDEDAAALYVYKGVMSPRSVERKLSLLAERRSR